MHGVLLPYPNGLDEDIKHKVWEYRDSGRDGEFFSKDTLTALFDGYSGNYIVIGHVIDKTEDWEGFYNPIQLLEPPSYNVELMYELVRLLSLNHEDYHPNWLVISHYT